MAICSRRGLVCRCRTVVITACMPAPCQRRVALSSAPPRCPVCARTADGACATDVGVYARATPALPSTTPRWWMCGYNCEGGCPRFARRTTSSVTHTHAHKRASPSSASLSRYPSRRGVGLGIQCLWEVLATALRAAHPTPIPRRRLPPRHSARAILLPCVSAVSSRMAHSYFPGPVQTSTVTRHFRAPPRWCSPNTLPSSVFTPLTARGAIYKPTRGPAGFSLVFAAF